MTLLVVHNNEVLVDSCTTIGMTKFIADKIGVIGRYKYACSGSPDVAEMYVSASIEHGEFNPAAKMNELPQDTTCVVLKSGDVVWTIDASVPDCRWVRAGSIQDGIQYVAGAGAELFTGFVASGMDVMTAFDKVCDINVFVDRPIRRF